MAFQIDRKARALRLRFADNSVLWLTTIGARLAADANPGSDAHRLAAACAQRRGWEPLIERPGWPVPRPRAIGDWLAVAHGAFKRLQRALVQKADIAQLPDSPPLDASLMALTADDDQAPLWPIPGDPGTRPRLLLLARKTFGDNRSVKRHRMARLVNLIETDPERQILWLGSKSASFSLEPASDMADAIRQGLGGARIQGPETPPPPREPPTTANHHGAAWSRHEPTDDDEPEAPDMGF